MPARKTGKTTSPVSGIDIYVFQIHDFTLKADKVYLEEFE